MSKQYVVQFGAGNPTGNTGLTPTFTVFKVPAGGGSTTPPGITEIPSATGLYYFTYQPMGPIAFVIDGGSSLSANSRYVAGSLDPVQAVDEVLGSTLSSYGSTSTDPVSVMGYVKRLQEFNEGNSTFTKASGTWDIYTRGATAELVQKLIVDNGTTVAKT